MTYSFAAANFPIQFSNFDNFITDPDYQNEISLSFLAWADVGGIQFELVPDTALVNIRIGWANFDGPGGILGDATIPASGPLSSAVIRLDELENWKLGDVENSSQIDFSLTVTHEIGHAIGILHSDDENALMHEFYRPDVNTLRQDDINAVQNLYGPATDQTNVYRYFNKVAGGHFFTANEIEKASVEALDEFRSEGVGFKGIAVSTPADANFVPVYRFFNKVNGGHFFTVSELERISVLSLDDFVFEGTAFKASDQNTVSTQPVYRFFNKVAGGHFFTASNVEKEFVLNQPEFAFEGVAFYAYADSAPPASQDSTSSQIEMRLLNLISSDQLNLPIYDFF